MHPREAVHNDPLAEEEAQALFVAGRVAYDDGRFDEALDLFQRSYARSEREELLFNIASAHDRLDQRNDALTNYRAFLDAAPDASRANFVRGRIAALEASLASDAAEPAGQTDAPTSNEPAARSRSLGLPIALFSAAAAVGAVALGTGIGALGLRGSPRDACPEGECAASEQGDIERMDRLALSTDILLGVAGAIAVAGVLTLVLRPTSETTEVACGFRGCSVRHVF